MDTLVHKQNQMAPADADIRLSRRLPACTGKKFFAPTNYYSNQKTII
jgi:hypothetical protein